MNNCLDWAQGPRGELCFPGAGTGAPVGIRGGSEHKMSPGKIKQDDLVSSPHGTPYGKGSEFDVGERESPPAFSHSFLAVLASPEVTVTKKKNEGSEGGEKFSQTDYLRTLQSGILKNHLHLLRKTGNLAVS